jgi:hypothetical protein
MSAQCSASLRAMDGADAGTAPWLHEQMMSRKMLVAAR